jgi:hypothetical protein
MDVRAKTLEIVPAMEQGSVGTLADARHDVVV